MDDLLVAYDPQLTSQTTQEQRIQGLQDLCWYISRIQSAIPPVEFELDLNQFALDTKEEEKQRQGYVYEEVDPNVFPRFETNETERLRRQLQYRPVPEAVDYAAQGAMTPVKDQGRCGCCWAVATMAAVESAVYLTPGTGRFLQSLSFQQLISCDKDNYGCNGGNTVSV